MKHSPEFEKFYQTIVSATPKGDQTIAQIRQSFEKMMADFRVPSDIQIREISIGRLAAYWIEAPGARKDGVILFFHGGGYTAGSTLSHQDLLGRLSRGSQYAVLGVNYRLAPEHPFPAAVEDAVLAYEYLLGTFRPDEIIVAGLSAGGGLALALLLALKEKNFTLPKAALGFSPWVDLTTSQPSIQGNKDNDMLKPSRVIGASAMYLSGGDPKKPLASPLFGDLEGLPPIYIQIGSREILLSENKLFVERAKKSGTAASLEIFEGMFHAWPLFASKLPEGQLAIDKACAFLKQHHPKVT